MLQIKCQGTPYEIGHQHGLLAQSQVHGSITFYRTMFQTSAQLTWSQVRLEAAKFLPFIQQPAWIPLKEEMEGLAAGAGGGIDFLDILALNVRTEIAYGMFNDGCTALSWKSQEGSFLAQNWDWDPSQSPNLITLHITPSPTTLLPRIHMVTEAGILGKIGLNSSSVGVTLNAIKSLDVDFSRIPYHLALHAVLNSHSRAEAVDTLTRVGVASAYHITVADAFTGGIGLECSHMDVIPIIMSGEWEGKGVCVHTNHFLEEHASGVVDAQLLAGDSSARLERVRSLVAREGTSSGGAPQPSFERRIEGILRDEEGYPCGICRSRADDCRLETLFSICMDLGGKKATVRVRRSVESGGEKLELQP